MYSMGHFFKKFAWIALFMALMAPVGAFAQEGFEQEPWEQDCDLPAPDSLWFFDITPYSITAGWTPVVGAAEYCLSILEVNTGNIAYFTTNQTEFKFTGLLPGEEYSISVGATLCSGNDCNYGDPENTRTWIIIGDIIIQRSCSPTATQQQRGFQGVQTYSLNLGGQNSIYVHAALTNDPGTYHEFYLLDDPSVPGALLMKTISSDNMNFPNPFRGGEIDVMDSNNQPIYTLGSLIQSTATAPLAFTITWHVPVNCTSGSGVCQPEDPKPKNAAPQIHAAPVPFNSHLSLRWEVDALSTAHAELYDMQGRLVHRSQAQNGSVYWPTDHLPPSIYILHTDTDGVREVRKLVKTK